MSQSKICVYPWSHVNINPNGDVWPCCHQRGDQMRVYGNFKEDDIDTIFNESILILKNQKLCKTFVMRNFSHILAKFSRVF